MSEKKPLPQKTAEGKEYITYKGYPVVRCKDSIYYGNMWDEYVVNLTIMEQKEYNGLQVATKIKVRQMATDEKLNPIEAIVKTSERSTLYDALDIAYAWLSRKTA